MAQIHVSIVTPEQTTFEEHVDSVVVPMLDGQQGILAGHAPMIGRLAAGELRTVSGSTTHRFYVDGGFVQVSDNSVSVLTGNSIPEAELDSAKAEAELAEANALKADKPELMELKQKAIDQAQAQLRMARQR